MPGALFVNIPARGHIHPTLPVVADLVALGERVTYCLPAEDEALIRPTGAAFRAVGNALPEARDRRGGSMSLAELPALAIRGATRTLPELLAAAAEVEPDYIVYDAYAAAGKFLARLLGLPAVATYATYAFNLTSLGSGAFGRLSERATVQAGLPGFDEAVAELVARFDLAPPTLFDLLLDAEALNVAFLPRAFQPAGDSFDERWVFVGPSLGNRAEPVALPEVHLKGGPVVYVSLGTIYNERPGFFRTCIEAVEATGWRVVLATGPWVDRNDLGPVPANVLALPWVPQLEMLARADAFVSHGGMNSTMEALAHAVPLVVVPQQAEQRVTADQVAALGLGRRLDPDATTPASLREAVASVLADDGLAARLGAMQAAALAGGGHRRAAQEILAFAHHRARRVR